eukprot:CAMPEP_0204328346 /NCGR_PEP_ID=MMETSP0469-20131031/13294_1 /ASSEMBLY_ACC=CAM_ASM_000384 /TAXON_ID=2969 /ORGANISM="Oxyrrhis marina" /LENGTH=249 /DNA_ID=CAMNT_0051310719 /DNA_START=186 /DNA_END=932 /DNA_ORIENTATION=+
MGSPRRKFRTVAAGNITGMVLTAPVAAGVPKFGNLLALIKWGARVAVAGFDKLDGPLGPHAKMLITADTASVVCFTSPTKKNPSKRCMIILVILLNFTSGLTRNLLDHVPAFAITNPILSLGILKVNGQSGLASLQASTSRFIASPTTSTVCPNFTNQSSFGVVSTVASAPAARYCMWSRTPAPWAGDRINSSSTGMLPWAGAICTAPPDGTDRSTCMYGLAGAAGRPGNTARAGAGKAGGAMPCPGRA